MAKKKALLLRIDPALHDELKRWADAELRSVNGQIEFLLRQAIRRRQGQAPVDAPTEAAEERDTDPNVEGGR